MRKIKAIVKRPEEPVGHMTYVSDNLENLQRIVKGPIETVYVREDLVIVCNEEGKIHGLPCNCIIPNDYLVGEIIVFGTKGDEFDDIPITRPEWKKILADCGNSECRE